MYQDGEGNPSIEGSASSTDCRLVTSVIMAAASRRQAREGVATTAPALVRPGTITGVDNGCTGEKKKAGEGSKEMHFVSKYDPVRNSGT